MDDLPTFKFHCTFGDTKKLVTSTLRDLRQTIEDKFSLARVSYNIRMFLPEVEDYIDWDEETETMVSDDASGKIWKLIIERSQPGNHPKEASVGMGMGMGMAMDSEADREAAKEAAQAKLYVGNLNQGTTNDEIRELFKGFGKIVECDVLTFYAFVHFETSAEAKAAADKLNQTEYKGKILKVQVSKSEVRQKPGMGKFTCYRCGENGHWTRHCPRQLEGKDRMGRSRYAEYMSPYHPRYPSPPREQYRPYPAADPYRRGGPMMSDPRDPYGDSYYGPSAGADYYRGRDPYFSSRASYASSARSTRTPSYDNA